jgi:hypothetical protein
MQPLPFRKVVVGFTVDSLQGVCILDVSCSRQHGCLGWGGGEVGVCRFKEWEFKAFFFFLFVGGSRGGRFWATIMAVIRKKIVQVCEGGAFDERVNIGSSHTCWHTVWYSCLFVCVSVCLLFGVAVSVPGEGSCCFVQWQVEMKWNSPSQGCCHFHKDTVMPLES